MEEEGSWDKGGGEVRGADEFRFPSDRAVTLLQLTGSTKIFHISGKAIHSLFSVKSDF